MNNWCVPFALAFVSGKTPDEIADLIKEQRGDNRAVKGVCQLHYLPVIRGPLGFKITAVVRRPGMTIRKWAANRVKCADKSTWLVMSNGHMMVYRDGIVYDNQQKAGIAADVYKYGTSRLRDAWQLGELK